ncbi:MAG: hypothetical protein K2N51_20865 [Lachnospiraceae bacterium]|nr:hypothetical protein [Lachnospiraceae bacterium]
MLNIVIFIIGLVVVVAGIGFEIAKWDSYEQKKEDYLKSKCMTREERVSYPEYKSKKLHILGSIAGIVIMIFAFSFTIIQTGYTGVRTLFGQVNEQTVPNGFNFHIPFVESIEKVNNKQQDITFKGKIWSETLNRTAIYYDKVTVTYQINKDKSAWIYANISNYEESLVTQSLVASAIKASSKELTDEDATNRGKIEPLSMKNIQESLDSKYGKETITVNKVVIANADFDKSYNKAVAEKQKAQLAYEKQQIENQKAIEQAQAKAEAKKIEAKGEADANELLRKSLSDDIFLQMMLEKWNGELPKVVGESNSMFDVSQFIGKEGKKHE